MTKSEENKSESLMNIEEVLSGVKGNLLSGKRDSFYFSNVATDSRNVKQGSLFVPLVGEFQDGHKYIPSSLEKGATVVFLSENSYENEKDSYLDLIKKFPEVSFICVKNTLTALQNCAQKYVEKFPHLIKISVTGSSGKTTTKEIANSILSEKFNVVCNKGNLNSETGLPISCFEINDKTEVALLEMGMNRVDEIGELALTFKPKYAVITNIGTAHIGLLGSRQKIAEEKKKIFNFLGKDGIAFIPKNDDFADFLSSNIEGKVIYYSKDEDFSQIQNLGIDGSTFVFKGEKINLSIPGIYNLYDCFAAVKLADSLGLSAKEIKAGVEKVKPLNGRSKILKGNFNILEDCYNANPDSMQSSLEFSDELEIDSNKIFVLGDMKELGNDSENEHEKVGKIVAESSCNLSVFIGSEMKAAYEKCKELNGNNNLKILYFEKYDDEEIKKIAVEILKFAKKGDFILLKGSHSVHLERFIDLLEKKGI